MIASKTSIVLAALLSVFVVACKRKTNAATTSATANAPRLVDLSTSLDAARAAFNGHDKEARFLALLSPT